MGKKLLQWYRRTPALWLVLAVELLVVGQAAWAAVQPPIQYSFTPEQLLPMTDKAGFDEEGRFGLTEWSDATDVARTPDMNLVAGHYRLTAEYYCPASYNGTGEPLISQFVLESIPQDATVGDAVLVDSSRTYAENMLTVHGTDSMHLIAQSSGGIFTVGNVTLCQDMFWAWLAVAGWILLFAALNAMLILLLPASPATVMPQTRRAMLVVIAAALVATLPFLGQTAVMSGHDWIFHLQRIECIADAMRYGQFPVRVYPTAKSGYGYGSPLFYGELFLYFPAVLRLLGVGVLASYRAYLLAVNLATAALTCLCLHRMELHPTAVLTGTVLYTLSYYRVACLYTRCAVGEYTAMTFLPLAAYGLWLLYAERGNPKKAWLPLMLAFSGCLQSHMITTLLMALITLVLVMVWWRKTLTRQRLSAWCKAAGGAILLNLWFLIPFLTTQMTGLYQLGSAPMQGKGVELRSLIAQDYFVGLGLALGVGAFLLLLVGNIGEHPVGRIGMVALLVGVSCSVMSTNLFPWNALSNSRLGEMLQTIQFPWRFLSLATFCMALATACGIHLLLGQGRRSMWGAAVCLVLTLITATGQFPHQELWEDVARMNDGSTVQLLHYATVTFSKNGMDSLYLPKGAVWEKVDHFALAPADGVEVGEFTRDNGVTTVLCASLRDSEGYVELPLLYYPGYKVVDGPGATYLTANGMVGVTVPAGYVGAISVAFREPKRWLLADGVSLVTLLAMLVWPLWKKRRRISKK